MNEVAARQMLRIGELEKELQEQKGMLWVLGEIMKVANNIGSFKDLMSVMTDMLMGVTGVNACYLWVYHDDCIKVFLRSTEFNNKFLELDESTINKEIRILRNTYVYTKEEIKYPLIDEASIPQSRLIVPLMDFMDGSIVGGLVLEHEQVDFFTSNNTVFFETLATFIASNTRNSRLFEQVSEESERDPLTGVYNRRHLNRMIDQLINQYNTLTIGIFDSDNFKAVNDVLGHIKGDEVLQSLSQFARQLVQEHHGKVIRYGGDEFVLLVPLPLEESMKIFETFLEAVPKLDVIKDISITVTVTMGVCAYPDMMISRSEMVHLADKALLRGKDEGKNCIKIVSQEDFE